MNSRPEARLFHLSTREAVTPRSEAAAPVPPSAPPATSPLPAEAGPAIAVEVVRGGAAAVAEAPPSAAEAPAAPSPEAPVEAPRRGRARDEDDPASIFADEDDGLPDMRAAARRRRPEADDSDALFLDEGDGLPDVPRQRRHAGRAAEAQPDPAAAQDALSPEALQRGIDALAGEEISARQFRIAQRIAASLGIDTESGPEAVVRLRARGVDPFQRTQLRRAVADEGARDSARPSPTAPALVGSPLDRPAARTPGMPQLRATANVPATRPAVPLPEAPGRGGRSLPDLPSREDMTEARRAAEIMAIQRDIARRRRRRLFMLFARLALFIGLPTLLAGWYYFKVATPQYATFSQFLIQQADSATTDGLGGLFAGTQLATNPDSVSVQSYLTSRDAMLRLDEELGFKRAFQDPSIDPLLRLPADASNEQAYKLYKNSVRIGYDPTEGVINMEVIAPDPKLSAAFSVALIRYAEGQVDQMTARLRSDQMKGAQASYDTAEAKVMAAQRRIQELQQQLGVLDPQADANVVMSQIATLESELTKKQLELAQLQSNQRPNPSRVNGVQGDIARLQELIAGRRAQLTDGTAAKDSLAQVTGEIRIAEGDLLTRQQLLATAAAQLETARIEAGKQVRYLSLSVAPVPPDQPTYPKALQNTIVAFVILSGIYLMLSLTASILREQVSS